MAKRIEQLSDSLLDHYLVVSLLLALIILTQVGVGNIKIVSLLGLLLCAIGILQRNITVDLWIFIPLVLYTLIGTVSSWRVYGNITDGYASTQALFPVLYLIMACLDKYERHLLKYLCSAWVGFTAIIGISQFIARALFQQRAWRASGFLGNPNALGIFLVIGWFSLLCCMAIQEESGNADVQCCKMPFLPYLEPILLICLALTLSMGSFLAMAAGIFMLVRKKGQNFSRAETFQYGCCLLAKASLGLGTGILIYLAAARTSVPLSCIPLLFYAAVMVYCWRTYTIFLAQKPRTAGFIALMGILVAAAAIAVRPSSFATFAERLEMMKNGLHYFTKNPLLGIGPYQWRLFNLYDSSKYFNTWHIHNVLIHIGAELGWIALAMLVLIAVCVYRKKNTPEEKAGFTAFCFHNMIDTSFFYLAIFSLTMLTVGNPGRNGQKLGTAAVRVFFSLSAVIFACHLGYSLWMG